jgi:hypothetical protein
VVGVTKTPVWRSEELDVSTVDLESEPFGIGLSPMDGTGPLY